jgi:hypothetical protein
MSLLRVGNDVSLFFDILLSPDLHTCSDLRANKPSSLTSFNNNVSDVLFDYGKLRALLSMAMLLRMVKQCVQV